MIHSILLVSKDIKRAFEEGIKIAEDFLTKSVKNNPDFFLLEDTSSIKIDQIRNLQQKLSLKPYSSPFKVALVQEAEKLTLPAQHSFLKTLEEPPKRSIIILVTTNENLLLPTIISRCQIIKISKKIKSLTKIKASEHLLLIDEIFTIIKATPGERILIAEEKCTDKEKTINFCQKQILGWRLLLLSKNNLLDLQVQKKSFIPIPDKQIVSVLKNLQESLLLLKTNTNPKLIVENLLISYPF